MSLTNRLAYLGIADFDYLSARILMLCGLGTTALPKAAEAFEKIFKLFLLLEAKITENKNLTTRDLKKFNHKLPSLFSEVKKKIPAKFDKELNDYFSMLQDAYSRRYPEHWREHTIQLNLEHLDKAYVYFRNGTILNFPPDEKERAKDFGTFIFDGYNSKLKSKIRAQGGKTPAEILKLNNKSYDTLDINKEKMI